MLQPKDFNVVVCRDLNCKLCSTASSLDSAAMQSQAYVVYTCESKKCRLCREETDVLLDLFCPFNTVEDVAEMTRKLNNITEAPWSSSVNDGFAQLESLEEIQDYADTDWYTFEEKIPSPSFQPILTPSCVIQSTPGQARDRQGTDFEIIPNLQPFDDSWMTDLEREFQVDQLEDLPELMDVGICDFIPR